MRNLRDQIFKLFGIVAVDYYIFPWDFNLPVFFVCGKFSFNKIIARFFDICVRDYQKYVPGIKVLKNLLITLIAIVY